MSHKSGIRHYSLKDTKKKDKDKKLSKNDNKEKPEKTATDISEKCGEKGSSGKEEQAETKTDTLQEGVSNQQKQEKTLGKEGTNTSGEKKGEEGSDYEEKTTGSEGSAKPNAEMRKRRRAMKQYLMRLGEKQKKEDKRHEFDLAEYYIRETFHSIEDAVRLFMDDDLFFRPGLCQIPLLSLLVY